MESVVRELLAQRLGGTQFGRDAREYKFAKLKRLREEARRAHPELELIDLGIGEPDSPADPSVVEELARQAGRPENRFYADNGIPEFRDAAVQYMADVYGVTGLDPDLHVCPSIGSKSALALMPLAFIDPGDAAVTTVPGYPVLATYTQYLGGEVYPLALTPENGFLPDLDSLTEEQRRRAKLLYLNYPNNPTGAVASREFFEHVVEFARRHRIMVVHDAAYAALTFDGERPLSFLSVPGALEVGVEIHSMSKAFNMTGWRMAWVCGNELAVKAFSQVKDNTDSGQFRAIQWACIRALRHPEITRRAAEKYARRHRMLAEVLREAGFDARPPKASFYLYVRAPRAAGSVEFATAEDFSQWLLTEKLIATVPWDEAGHFVRLSVTFEAQDEDDERRIIREVGRRLSGAKFVF
ncbi:MAG: LL-diaminopimelate aminotransferase [Firmicutes bacterium]|nr:LL-diaminopimelate aminotransferase [Bacillota bacterium]